MKKKEKIKTSRATGFCLSLVGCCFLALQLISIPYSASAECLVSALFFRKWASDLSYIYYYFISLHANDSTKKKKKKLWICIILLKRIVFKQSN